MRQLRILTAGPGVTVQDDGRPGRLAEGLQRGGAADRLALDEGAALLGYRGACIEIPPVPLAIRVEGGPVRIALTGAARHTDPPLPHDAVTTLADGIKVSLAPPRRGRFTYVHIGGGIATEPILGSRAAHLRDGIGRPLAAGDVLPLAPDPAGDSDLAFDPAAIPDRFGGGTIRILPSIQTAQFTTAERERFAATPFKPHSASTRAAIRLIHDGPGFRAERQLDILSEPVVPGDVQITGDGTAFILMPECQTTGGYPRIGTVAPQDLPRVAQTAPGVELRFAFTDPDLALDDLRSEMTRRARLPDRIGPLRRDPRDMGDLLSYQLISGVTDGRTL